MHRLLVDRLRASGATVVDRLAADHEIQSRYVGFASASTAAKALAYGICRPDWSSAVFGVLRHSQSRRTVRSVVRIQNQLRVSIALAKANQLVLDEWFIHEAWLAIAESRRVQIRHMENLLRHVSARLATIPRLLVRLRVSPAIAASRVLSRAENTWFQQLSHVELVRLLDEANASLDVLARASCENSTAVVMLDTSETSPSEIVAQLLPQVRAFQ